MGIKILVNILNENYKSSAFKKKKKIGCRTYDTFNILHNKKINTIQISKI